MPGEQIGERLRRGWREEVHALRKLLTMHGDIGGENKLPERTAFFEQRTPSFEKRGLDDGRRCAHELYLVIARKQSKHTHGGLEPVCGKKLPELCCVIGKPVVVRETGAHQNRIIDAALVQ